MYQLRYSRTKHLNRMNKINIRNSIRTVKKFTLVSCILKFQNKYHFYLFDRKY